MQQEQSEVEHKCFAVKWSEVQCSEVKYSAVQLNIAVEYSLCSRFIQYLILLTPVFLSISLPYISCWVWSIQCTLNCFNCTVLTIENSTVLHSSLQQPIIFLSSPLVTRKEQELGITLTLTPSSTFQSKTSIFFFPSFSLSFFFVSSVLIFYKSQPDEFILLKW